MRTVCADFTFTHANLALVARCQSTAKRKETYHFSLIQHVEAPLPVQVGKIEENMFFWCFGTFFDECKTLGKKSTLTPLHVNPGVCLDCA